MPDSVTERKSAYLQDAPESVAPTLDPALLALRSELEQLDYVVVRHGDHICVRLPLISSVRIRHNGNRFRFTPQFGPFRRSGGLLFTSGVSTAAVAGTAFTFGLDPATLVVGFLGFVALAHDACRFIITEGCLTRLQQIIATTIGPRIPPGGVLLDSPTNRRIGT
jgi:hypothetical protein